MTNDAVQKYSVDYGKYESSNKLSYSEFEKILREERGVSFLDQVMPKIKDQVADVFNAVGTRLYWPKKVPATRDASKGFYNGFELMGLDFMLDD